MSHYVAILTIDFKGLSAGVGSSTRHGRDKPGPSISLAKTTEATDAKGVFHVAHVAIIPVCFSRRVIDCRLVQATQSRYGPACYPDETEVSGEAARRYSGPHRLRIGRCRGQNAGLAGRRDAREGASRH